MSCVLVSIAIGVGCDGGDGSSTQKAAPSTVPLTASAPRLRQHPCDDRGTVGREGCKNEVLERDSSRRLAKAQRDATIKADKRTLGMSDDRSVTGESVLDRHGLGRVQGR
jgi:hypothetical protein